MAAKSPKTCFVIMPYGDNSIGQTLSRYPERAVKHYQVMFGIEGLSDQDKYGSLGIAASARNILWSVVKSIRQTSVCRVLMKRATGQNQDELKSVRHRRIPLFVEFYHHNILWPFAAIPKEPQIRDRFKALRHL